MFDELKKYEAICSEMFSTHKATVITENDRFFIIDWRREDGDILWYINFIVDKKRGALIVSGDLGSSIAVWYNNTEPEKIRDWISNDVGYYTDKIQCASDLYVYDEDDIIKDIMEHIDDEDLAEFLENSTEYDGSCELRETLDDLVYDSVHDRDIFIPSGKLYSIMNEIDPDSSMWLPDCGKRINGRVYIWAIAFHMAMEQLGR